MNMQHIQHSVLNLLQLNTFTFYVLVQQRFGGDLTDVVHASLVGHVDNYARKIIFIRLWL